MSGGCLHWNLTAALETQLSPGSGGRCRQTRWRNTDAQQAARARRLAGGQAFHVPAAYKSLVRMHALATISRTRKGRLPFGEDRPAKGVPRRRRSSNPLHDLRAALISRTGKDTEVAVQEDHAQRASTGALEMAYVLRIETESGLGRSEALAPQYN